MAQENKSSQTAHTIWQHPVSAGGLDKMADHCSDVIMGTVASQITSITIVYTTVYSDADQENIKAPRHWPLCWEFTGDRWIPRTNGQ